jgi:hypothetical protein
VHIYLSTAQGLLDELGIKVVRKSAAKAAPPAAAEEEEVMSAPAPKAKKGKKKVSRECFAFHGFHISNQAGREWPTIGSSPVI